MKRLRTILLFLLLGAVVNVAVAWGCALWRIAIPQARAYLSESDDKSQLILTLGICVGSSRVMLLQSSRNFLSFDHPQDILKSAIPVWASESRSMIQSGSSRFSSWMVIEEAHGWPVRSFSQTLYSLNGPSGGWIHEPSHEDYEDLKDALSSIQSPTPRLYKGIPYRPLLNGTVINTLFFTTAIWLLFVYPFVFVRSIRERDRRIHGLCLKCAYDLKGAAHEVCPECGTEIVKVKPA